MTDYEVILELIAATTTGGLTVTSHLDTHEHPTGLKITNAEFAAVPVTPHDFHGDWNYTMVRHEAPP